ncbi:MAG: beta-Ala-His dipeptidase, partial [Bacteroidales bacterium]|nr:beta-Ala-His dipeptidase [Bacteroidales bacterium]
MSIFYRQRPALVWKYFEEICRIPRTSRNEEKIRKYLLDFASEKNLESKEDKAGNILIIRPASPGMEKVKSLVLQSHMDMVGEKETGLRHDWLRDPVIPFVRNGWVSAKGTTLGADDGIGIAAQLAVLSDKRLRTGKIEALFTVDEETGMTGANNLNPEFFESRTLLNLDSEDEGIIYIGCAGGIETSATISYIPQRLIADDSICLGLSISGLHGGHSGDEIHKGYGNAIKLISRLVRSVQSICKIKLASIEGGNLRNAIPREAKAVIVAGKQDYERISNIVDDYRRLLVKEIGTVEKEFVISVTNESLPEFVPDNKTCSRVLEAIDCLPHGVIDWSKEMDDLVETSSNLASVRFSENNRINIVTTQRSSLETGKKKAAEMAAECLRKAGAEVKHSQSYPGWQPNLSSEILSIAKLSYRRLFGKEPL